MVDAGAGAEGRAEMGMEEDGARVGGEVEAVGEEGDGLAAGAMKCVAFDVANAADADAGALGEFFVSEADRLPLGLEQIT